MDFWAIHIELGSPYKAFLSWNGRISWNLGYEVDYIKPEAVNSKVDPIVENIGSSGIDMGRKTQ